MHLEGALFVANREFFPIVAASFPGFDDVCDGCFGMQSARGRLDRPFPRIFFFWTSNGVYPWIDPVGGWGERPFRCRSVARS